MGVCWSSWKSFVVSRKTQIVNKTYGNNSCPSEVFVYRWLFFAVCRRECYRRLTLGRSWFTIVGLLLCCCLPYLCSDCGGGSILWGVEERKPQRCLCGRMDRLVNLFFVKRSPSMTNEVPGSLMHLLQAWRPRFQKEISNDNHRLVQLSHQVALETCQSHNNCLPLIHS